MKIMVMDSGRGNNREVVSELRSELSLEPSDELVWVAYYPPQEPLPVVNHLVLGPGFRLLRRPARRAQTMYDDPRFHADLEAAQMHPDDALGPDGDQGHDMLGLSTQQLDEQLPETVQDHPHHDESSRESRIDAARSALQDSERLRNAVRWRANAARLRVTAFYARGAASLKRRVNKGQSPVARVLRVVGSLIPGIGAKFGLNAFRSEAVAAAAAGCDVLLSYDTRSQKAVWLVARKVPRPAAVVGVAAAKSAIESRRPGSVRPRG